MPDVRVRFAPSPTGFLHIGGVRSALFNWLFARRHGGSFILRIDDTDQERNVEAALAPILHGLRWLGIEWDEGPEIGGPHAPYFQSQRSARHQEAVDQLLRSGHAYRDYSTQGEMEAERKAGRGTFHYSRRWMATTDEERLTFESEGRVATVRLNMPSEGSLVIRDLVRGDIEFQWAEEQDHLIQRADGTCVYHLATVVDDRDFGITHVIRSEEHLPNTPRQAFIARALGCPLPQYAHLPYVAEPGSKQKLSKRNLHDYLENPHFAEVHEHGMAIAAAMGPRPAAETFNPVVVDFYEQVGFLPDAIVNYLVLLGWSLDDRTEILTRAQQIENFSLERVSAAAASFDPAKLVAFQARYMRELPIDERVARVLPYLERAGLARPPLSRAELDRIRRIVELLGDRLKISGDILLQAGFFFTREVSVDENAFAKVLLAPGAAERLADYREWLAGRDVSDPAALEADTRAHLADRGLRLKDIVHAVRVAVTGSAAGPALFDCMALLGKPECLRRIDAALARAAGAGPTRA
jgi:glutamyl-tRNA synthetase